jgi:hypothetical protein
MVNLQLTYREWYFLHIQVEKLLKENPSNHIAKDLLTKLAKNAPLLKDIKSDFKQEYECIFSCK